MAVGWNSGEQQCRLGHVIGAADSRSKARSAGKCSGNRHPDLRETTTASYLQRIRDINVCAHTVRRRVEERRGRTGGVAVQKRFKFVCRSVLNYKNVGHTPIASIGSSVYL